MTDYSTTKNRMEPGGDVWSIDGHVDRGGAPVLPLSTLKAQIVQHYSVAPAAVGVATVHAAVELTEAAQTVTTAITNPDVPRIVTIKGSAAGMAGDVTITGTNINDEVVTDTIALNAATEVLGVVAFKTVTSFALPVLTTAGDTVSVGTGKKIGLPHIVAYATLLLVKLFNGSADTGTLTVDAKLEKNVFAINGSPDGAKKVDLYYMV